MKLIDTSEWDTSLAEVGRLRAAAFALLTMMRASCMAAKGRGTEALRGVGATVAERAADM